MKNEKLIGYKAFYQDEKGLYCKPNNKKKRYKEGKVFEIKGELSLCQNGIHFCRELKDIFEFYPLVQWISVHKVEILGDVLDDKKGAKSCTNKLKVLETIEFKEIIRDLKLNSEGVNRSNGINNSDGVNNSEGVNNSFGVNNSEGVDFSEGVNFSFGVNNSDGVNRSNGINRSEGVNFSDGVNNSDGVNFSDGVNSSGGINRSEGVNFSDGVNNSKGVNFSFGVINSQGVSNSLFLANRKENYSIFGIEVAEDRFNQIRDKLYQLLNGWRPHFNNIKKLYLKYGGEWKLTPIQAAEEVQKKKAWADMPIKAIKYVMSLEEFNKEMFEEITGIDTDKIKGGRYEQK